MCFDCDGIYTDLEILNSMSGIVKGGGNILKDDLACYKLMVEYEITLIKEFGTWWSYTNAAVGEGKGVGYENTFEYDLLDSASTPNRAICKAVIRVEEAKRDKILKAYLDGCYDKGICRDKGIPNAYHQEHWMGHNPPEE